MLCAEVCKARGIWSSADSDAGLPGIELGSPIDILINTPLPDDTHRSLADLVDSRPGCDVCSQAGAVDCVVYLAHHGPVAEAGGLVLINLLLGDVLKVAKRLDKLVRRHSLQYQDKSKYRWVSRGVPTYLFIEVVDHLDQAGPAAGITRLALQIAADVEEVEAGHESNGTLYRERKVPLAVRLSPPRITGTSKLHAVLICDITFMFKSPTQVREANMFLKCHPGIGFIASRTIGTVGGWTI